MITTGVFASNPDLLKRFRAEWVTDDNLNPILRNGKPYAEAEIVEAHDHVIIYSDGMRLNNPLSPDYVSESAMPQVFAYLEDAMQTVGNRLPKVPERCSEEELDEAKADRLSILLAEAFSQWGLDLRRKQGEVDLTLDDDASPKLMEAIEYAITDPDMPTARVAEAFGVGIRPLSKALSAA
jgi:hypothetical protein